MVTLLWIWVKMRLALSYMSTIPYLLNLNHLFALSLKPWVTASIGSSSGFCFWPRIFALSYPVCDLDPTSLILMIWSKSTNPRHLYVLLDSVSSRATSYSSRRNHSNLRCFKATKTSSECTKARSSLILSFEYTTVKPRLPDIKFFAFFYRPWLTFFITST